MGIKNGAPEILKSIRFGLYNRNGKVYDINVDGENLRFKGYVATTLCKDNAEELISENAHLYLERTIKSIEHWMGKPAREIKIYMDGKRVANKESRPEKDFDVSLIRLFFMQRCLESNWKVFKFGEAELDMYLLRDKTVNLNVFITNDSDMMSICYGHEPVCATNVLNIKSQVFDEFNTTLYDSNRIYDDQQMEEFDMITSENVYDSCLWVNTTKQVLNFVGFDYLADKLQFSKHIFRVMMAMCGTDFTTGILTNTQIKALITPGQENINRYSAIVGKDTSPELVNNIIIALLVLSFREGGVRNRIQFTDNDKFDYAEFINGIKIYCQYIETGVMEGTIVHQNSGLIIRHYLYAMLGQKNGVTGKALKAWAKNAKIEDVIKNCSKYLGTFNASSFVSDRTKKSLAEREKFNQMVNKNQTVVDTNHFGEVTHVTDNETGLDVTSDEFKNILALLLRCDE